MTHWTRALVPAQLRLSLGRHPNTRPIARANLETAAAVAAWAEIACEGTVAPKRQNPAHSKTTPFWSGEAN